MLKVHSVLPPISLGTYNVLVFLNEFSDGPLPPQVLSVSQRNLRNWASLTNQLYLNMSYGRFNVNFTYDRNLAPRRLPGVSSFYCNENFFDADMRITDSLRLSKHDPQLYHMIMSATDIESYGSDLGVCSGMDFASPGMAIHNHQPFGSIPHEVGHTLNLPHTDTWLSSNRNCPFSTNGKIWEGGSGVDIMGYGDRSSEDDTQFMHIVMPYKFALDWTDMVRTVYLPEKSASIVLWPQDIDAPTMGFVTRAIRILLPVEPTHTGNHISQYNELWLETRHLMRHDFDSRGVLMMMARKMNDFPLTYQTLVIDNTVQPGASGSIYDGLLGPRQVQHFYHPSHSVTINNTAELRCPGFPYLTCYNISITRTNPSVIPCPVN